MSNYREIVNKVIQESGSEIDELTTLTWAAPVAGRRLYPRIKRLVSEAWKVIQMSRNEWEFKNKEYNAIVTPRIKLNGGFSSTGAPSPGVSFKGRISGFEFAVKNVITTEGDWTIGTAVAQIEIEEPYAGTTMVVGEVFDELPLLLGAAEFTYLQKGSYNFSDVDPFMREILWETFVTSQDQTSPIPVLYIPWDNWLYKDLSFTSGSRTVPLYVSQDYEGNVVFYPQTLDPFRVSFIYDTGPQILEDEEDVPSLIKAEYHDWIAWTALMNLARYDKNTTLFNYAQSMATFYARRAERDLMPMPSWGPNRFNRGA